ncbi:hypothetical protein L8Q48_16970 [Enterobacter roggenkampii]|uniref:hypothetical protein n=1 Tax=Enterobacter roggenkampii TaxID=1812935 RepID=UPI0020064E21|nr:hypothetical protein [Enterobacter roggenkampii]MCK6928897.1 hypothetical protein [Enterobacter roggenkampii]
MSTITKERVKDILNFGAGRIISPITDDEIRDLARIALASLEAEPVAFRSKLQPPNAIGSERWDYTDHRQPDAFELESCVIERLYTAPPAPVSVPESAPVAYIFKHPAGRLFWSLTDESNKGQSDVMPVYSAPVPAFVPPAIEPDYEVIKGILPTANPDEYACCIAADMWNACRNAMLQGADGKSPVIPDGWVMVPVEPTAEMQSAAAGAIRFDTTPINKLWTGNAVYRAMLAAAPQQEVK